MELYHFCPAHMLDGIKTQGLTLGHTPVFLDDGIGFISGTQWLTSEPDAAKQSWATSRLIPYSRTAYRLTIEIPDRRKQQKRLYRAQDFMLRTVGDTRILDGYPGSENWYVFEGSIPPAWITAIHATNAGRLQDAVREWGEGNVRTIRRNYRLEMHGLR